MVQKEHVEQALVTRWALLQSGKYPMLKYLYAVPNGAFYSGNKLTRIKLGAKMKAEGVKKGVPDLCLPYPAKSYHALYIEMKKPGGVISPEQKDYLNYLNSTGYLAVTCYSYEDAKSALMAYLSIKE